MSGDAFMQIFENPIDDMIVKQARSVTNAGIAQIQAASDGVSSIIGIFTPVLWSRLFEFFAGRPEASLVFFIFGPVSPPLAASSEPAQCC